MLGFSFNILHLLDLCQLPLWTTWINFTSNHNQLTYMTKTIHDLLFVVWKMSKCLPIFPSCFYTKNWYPHPLLATSTPKLSGSNSSHGRSTCASCWSVDYFFKPWRFSPEISKPQETLKKIDKQFGDQRLSPHFNFQQEKYPSLQLEPSSHH